MISTKTPEIYSDCGIQEVKIPEIRQIAKRWVYKQKRFILKVCIAEEQRALLQLLLPYHLLLFAIFCVPFLRFFFALSDADSMGYSDFRFVIQLCADLLSTTVHTT